jgi:hypothetical protein
MKVDASLQRRRDAVRFKNDQSREYEGDPYSLRNCSEEIRLIRPQLYTSQFGNPSIKPIKFRHPKSQQSHYSNKISLS